MGIKKLDDLEARAFADMILTGSCPRCGSDNAHSCEYDPEDPDSSVIECEVAKAIDSPVTGHCEDCGCLFCTECRTALRGAEEKPLSELATAVNAHEKNCSELMPRRWAEKYGLPYLLTSVKENVATIEGDSELVGRNSARRYTLKIGKECGMAPEELGRRVGQYMKFDIDWSSNEIVGVAEMHEIEFQGPSNGGELLESASEDATRQVGVSYYTPNEFLQAKQAGLFPKGDFENYDEWLETHKELVDNLLLKGYRVADIEVRVDEFLGWQKAQPKGQQGVSSYVADLLSRAKNILKRYKAQDIT